MTTLSSSPVERLNIGGTSCVAIKHKPQPSQDSGAYIDWNSTEERQSNDEHHAGGIRDVPKEVAEVTTVRKLDKFENPEEFITVVSVEPKTNQSNDDDDSFVTVLSIGDKLDTADDSNINNNNGSICSSNESEEDVLVYRLPGERLGFGLKFDGGLNSSEKVTKLLIQSCTPDSPASRTSASWGFLSGGDRILRIDGVPVHRMTRVECVRRLKESNVVLKLTVKKRKADCSSNNNNTISDDVKAINGAVDDDDDDDENRKNGVTVASTDYNYDDSNCKLPLERTISLPPPVPPRKYPRRISSPRTRPSTVPIVYPPDAFADDDDNRKFSDLEFFERTVLTSYNDATIVTSCLDEEITIDRHRHQTQESESDDTGSSMSTVIDRFSTSNSSFSDVRSISSVDIGRSTSPEITINKTAAALNLDKVLEPFLQLEREFSSNPIEDGQIFQELVAATAAVCNNNSNNNENAGNDNNSNHRRNSWPNKNNRTQPIVSRPPKRQQSVKTTYASGKYGKKRPPPPPPPPLSSSTVPHSPLVNEIADNAVTDIEHKSVDELIDDRVRIDRYSQLIDDSVEIERTLEAVTNHLPRLIDFVPKDRTDVIAPSAVLATNNIAIADPIELLLERQRLLDIINNNNNNTIKTDQRRNSFVGIDDDRRENADNKYGREHRESSNDDDTVDVIDDDAISLTGRTLVLPSDFDEPSLVETDEWIKPKERNKKDEQVCPNANSDNVDNKREQIESICIATGEMLVDLEAEQEINQCITGAGGSNNINDDDESRRGIKESYFKIGERVPYKESPGKLDPIEEKDNSKLSVKSNEIRDENLLGSLKRMEPILAITPSVNINLTLPLTAQIPPPPSYSRMPPDGHEFPSNYQEEEQVPPLPSPPPPPLLSPREITSKMKSCYSDVDDEVKIINRDDDDIFTMCRKSSTSSVSGLEDSVFVKTGTTNTATNIYSRRPQLWNKDEKSERSVKDKIAMFSTGTAPPPLPASPVTPSAMPPIAVKSKFSSGKVNRGDLSSSKAFSKSVLSVVDNVDYDTIRDDNNINNNSNNNNNNNNIDYLSRARSSIDLTLSSSSSSSAYSSCSPESSLSPMLSRVSSSSPSSSPSLGSSNTLPRNNKIVDSSSSSFELPVSSSVVSSTIDKKSTLTRAISFAGSTSLHYRSQSLSDGLHCPMISRRNSEDNNSNNRSNGRDSLSQLIEQRRRTMSKLRGLVIPEKVVENRDATILDLPEIKSKDSSSGDFLSPDLFHNNNNNDNSNNENIVVPATSVSNLDVKIVTSVVISPTITTDVWKSDLSGAAVDIPKYSPAFKRKSLALCGVPSSATSSVSSSLSSSREELRQQSQQIVKSVPPSKPPRNSLFNNHHHHNSNNSESYPQTSIESRNIATDTTAIVSSTQMTNSWNKIEEVSPTKKVVDIDDVLSSRNQSKLISTDELIKSSKTPDDSDNDSAVSSSRSSLCHDLSPGSSPTPISRNQSTVYIATTETCSSRSSSNRTLTRTLSSETTVSTASSVSTLTSAASSSSGSRASCSNNNSSSSSSSSNGEIDDLNPKDRSSSVGKRILKPQSVEAINRKSVLSSARYSSGGRDYEDNTSTDVLQDDNDYHEHRHRKRWFKNDRDDFEIIKKSSMNNDNLKIAYIEIRDDSDDETNRRRRRQLSTNRNDGDAGEIMPALEESWSTCESDKDSSVADHLDDKRDQDDIKSTDEDSDVGAGRYISLQSRHNNNNNNNNSNNNNSCGDDLITTKITTGLSNSVMLTADDDNSTNNTKSNKIKTKTIIDNVIASKKSFSNSSSLNGISNNNNNNKRPSVTDLRKAFEKVDTNSNNVIGINNGRRLGDFRSKSLQQQHSQPSLKRDSHVRMSSLDSTTSEESFIPRSPSQYDSTSNLLLRDQQFGSITSLASSTSLISQQELQQLIEDANHTLEETTGSEGYNVMVIILHRDTATSSVGITLAGGADYECKEITVHKVLAGSPADRDGRILKGDRILSINGRNVKDVTHREALSILKAPRSEVVLVVSRWKADGPQCSGLNEDPLIATFKNNIRPPRIPELNDVVITAGIKPSTSINRGPVTTVTLIKDGGGLGFSLEGGKDSPLGDLPLVIKKIFTGGCADKSGLLSAGDELLSLNGLDVTTMSRTEAWNVMKRLADGEVALTIRRSLKSETAINQ